MTPGVGSPHFRSSATWTGSGWDSAYPVTNLSDAIYLSNVARAAAPGYVSARFTLPSAMAIQMICLANHNLSASATMRVRLYSSPTFVVGTDTPVADTGVVSVWPTPSAPVLLPNGNPRFVQSRPIVFNTPVSAQGGFIEIQSYDGTKVQVGLIDLAAWWAWPGISLGRETGIDTQQTSVQLAGGGFWVPEEFTGRLVNGSIDYVALGASTDQALDFQFNEDLNHPFCFVSDYSDPTTWSRECMMVTNNTVPALAGAAYRSDKFAFQFIEHYR